MNYLSTGAGFQPSRVAPANMPSQQEINLPTIDFQGRTVSFRAGYNHPPYFLLLSPSIKKTNIKGDPLFFWGASIWFVEFEIRFSRPYQGTPMVNKPLIRPYIRGGGYVRGGRLISHKATTRCNIPKTPKGSSNVVPKRSTSKETNGKNRKITPWQLVLWTRSGWKIGTHKSNDHMKKLHGNQLWKTWIHYKMFNCGLAVLLFCCFKCEFFKTFHVYSASHRWIFLLYLGWEPLRMENPSESVPEREVFKHRSWGNSQGDSWMLFDGWCSYKLTYTCQCLVSV